MVQVPCDQCFMPINKGGAATVFPHNFCSRICYHAWRRANMASIAPKCGTKLAVKRMGPDNPGFKHGKAALRDKPCEWCSAIFRGMEHNRFCSMRCKSQWNIDRRFNGPNGEEWRLHYSKENSGERNKNWRGGRSILPYTVGWHRGLSEQIRERDGNKCYACQGTKCLVVHHRDLEKSNHDPSNLITLCQACHIRLHHNKWEFLPST